MKKFFQLHKMTLLMAISVALFYLSFGYDLDRSDFIKLFGLYAASFFLTWKLIKIEKNQFWLLAVLALIFRLIFLFAIPNLSQDFYRFIWDGRMIVSGWNPYLYLPENLITSDTAPIAEATELFKGMGALNASHFTNYPPLNQLIFALAGILSEKSILGSVVVLRSIIILADLGTLYFGRKLLQKLKLPEHQIFWFILNPFIIIELTGNLHFEGVMIFLLILSIYFLLEKKWILSALFMAFSISLKLLPLIFLPLLFRYFSRNNKVSNLSLGKLILYYLIVGVVVILSFLPFLSSALISNFADSIGLWFQKFEFNASIYYLVRWMGFQVKGYNIIATAGKVLPIIVVLIIGALALFRKNDSGEKLIGSMLLAVSIYFFLSTTVHPWYIAMPLIFTVFTRYKFALVWSFMVILSYTAYANDSYQENLWMVALEYLVVIGMFIYEVFWLKKDEKSGFFIFGDNNQISDVDNGTKEMSR